MITQREGSVIKLCIITPYYNRLLYIKDLSKVLAPQLNESVEWIIVDDGSNDLELDTLPATVIHLKENSGGASVPRNVGLDRADCEYVAFIDSDDMVVDDYVETILNKIENEDFDYCLYSWDNESSVVTIIDEPPPWNHCVWNCVYKRSLIGEHRFREDLIISEDYWFNHEVRKGKRANIQRVLYHYRLGTPDSLWKQGVVENKKWAGE